MKDLMIELNQVKTGITQRFRVKNPLRCAKRSVYSDTQHLATRIIAIAALVMSAIAVFSGC